MRIFFSSYTGWYNNTRVSILVAVNPAYDSRLSRDLTYKC